VTVLEAELIAFTPGGMAAAGDFQPIDSEKGIEQTRFLGPPVRLLVLCSCLIAQSPAPLDPQSDFMGCVVHGPPPSAP
jgi:hypothetical protein